MLQKRLSDYFKEAKVHIGKIQQANKILKEVMPLCSDSFETLSEKEQDKLDILAFRFSKLQDLLGDKIFRMILEYSGFNVQKKFIELLSELEKEGLLDLDKWIELRNARNKIAHEYPDEQDNLIEAINFIFEESAYLIDLTQKLEEYFDEITATRDN